MASFIFLILIIFIVILTIVCIMYKAGGVKKSKISLKINKILDVDIESEYK